ncbi:hypothetical protein [Spongiimicrobium salis]|uniref:hypothetical protein n=1 Tax=Spongiimicrobium salis TaxID=1667022 RepID=UPI00374DFB33
MKNIFILIAALLGFHTIQAQAFLPTEKYTVVKQATDKESEYESYAFHLVQQGMPFEMLSTIIIEDDDLFEGVALSVLESPDLEGVLEIIKIEVEYAACCSGVEAYYFMMTDTNDLVALPMLENVYCEGPEPNFQYIFPNQAYGTEGTILKTKVIYDDSFDIQKVAVLDRIVWKDDDFEMEVKGDAGR